jgi:hypothetical protein
MGGEAVTDTGSKEPTACRVTPMTRRTPTDGQVNPTHESVALAVAHVTDKLLERPVDSRDTAEADHVVGINGSVNDHVVRTAGVYNH